MLASGLSLIAAARLLAPAYFTHYSSSRLLGLGACWGLSGIACVLMAVDGFREAGRTPHNLLLLVAAAQAIAGGVLFFLGARRRRRVAPHPLARPR